MIMGSLSSRYTTIPVQPNCLNKPGITLQLRWIQSCLLVCYFKSWSYRGNRTTSVAMHTLKSGTLWGDFLPFHLFPNRLIVLFKIKVVLRYSESVCNVCKPPGSFQVPSHPITINQSWSFTPFLHHRIKTEPRALTKPNVSVSCISSIFASRTFPIVMALLKFHSSLSLTRWEMSSPFIWICHRR